MATVETTYLYDTSGNVYIVNIDDVPAIKKSKGWTEEDIKPASDTMQVTDNPKKQKKIE